MALFTSVVALQNSSPYQPSTPSFFNTFPPHSNANQQSNCQTVYFCATLPRVSQLRSSSCLLFSAKPLHTAFTPPPPPAWPDLVGPPTFSRSLSGSRPQCGPSDSFNIFAPHPGTFLSTNHARNSSNSVLCFQQLAHSFIFRIL